VEEIFAEEWPKNAIYFEDDDLKTDFGELIFADARNLVEIKIEKHLIWHLCIIQTLGRKIRLMV